MAGTQKRYSRLGEARFDHLTHISRRHRLVYLEVPKTGCTVVKRVLQHAERGGPGAGGSVHDRAASPLGAPLRDGFDLDELFARESPWLTFTFVRNPFTRALSAWLEKIAGPAHPRMRDLRVHNLGFRPGEDVGFRTFLERVAEQRPAAMDIHWMPQVRLASFGKVEHDFVGRFETFERDLRSVMAVSGLDVPDDLVTTRSGHSTDAGSRLAEHYADPRCVELVQQIYARDFALLGYGDDVRLA